MSKLKVVVTDWEFANLQYERAVLQHPKIELVAAQCQTEQEVIEQCRDADAVINQYAPISRTVIAQLKRCRIISRYGVGVNTIDVAQATEKGIFVTNVPDYCVDEVSDHTLALILGSVRKICKASAATKKQAWDFKNTKPIYRLRGRRLGLCGFGKIPQAVAKKAKPFGLEVWAYDPYVEESVFQALNVKRVTLEELCSGADVISVHVPLTEKTRGLIGEKQFAFMKKEAFVINTSRGPVIEEQALLQALQKGKIAGCALDVVEEEPIRRDHPFLQMDEVILTPHMAWYSEEAEKELRTKVAEDVYRVLIQGRNPRYPVNPEVLES